MDTKPSPSEFVENICGIKLLTYQKIFLDKMFLNPNYILYPNRNYDSYDFRVFKTVMSILYSENK